MKMDHVNFEGTKYPTIDIHVDGYGIRTIAPESLEEKILQRYADNYDKAYEAKWVDSMIFFFVPDVLFKAKDAHEKIRQCVLSSLNEGRMAA